MGLCMQGRGGRGRKGEEGGRRGERERGRETATTAAEDEEDEEDEGLVTAETLGSSALLAVSVHFKIEQSEGISSISALFQRIF